MRSLETRDTLATRSNECEDTVTCSLRLCSKIHLTRCVGFLSVSSIWCQWSSNIAPVTLLPSSTSPAFAEQKNSEALPVWQRLQPRRQLRLTALAISSEMRRGLVAKIMFSFFVSALTLKTPAVPPWGWQVLFLDGGFHFESELHCWTLHIHYIID